MLLFWSCVLCALFSSGNGENGESAGHPLHNDDRNFPKRQEAFQHLQRAQTGSTFNLRVQVNDLLTRQQLSQAVVEVFINFTKNTSALSGENGSALLHVPYHSGLPIIVVASKASHVPALLLCETNRIPIFSSVTMSMLRHIPGNIWLFEDFVQITGKNTVASPHPIVKFPKSLLNLTESSDIASVTSYVTIPELTTEQDGSLNTLGVIISKSEHISVELSPVTAVCVQLFLGKVELNLSGPIQLSLNVPNGQGLQTSDVVPAWFFDKTIGGWVRKGLGKVISVNEKLFWTFTAPHLGYWMAATLSPSKGFFDVAVSVDFIFHRAFILMVLFGGTLVAAICLLFGILYFCRKEENENKTTRIPPRIRKDQTTSTCDNGVFESSSDTYDPEEDQNLLETGDNQRNASFMSKQRRDVTVNPDAVTIVVESTELEPNGDQRSRALSQTGSEQISLPASLTDNFFIYNQPVAIIPAPAFFQLEEHLEESQWSKSATLPRAMEPKGTFPTQNRGADAQDQNDVTENSQVEGSASTPRSLFSLPESVSVPGTLNKIGERRHLANTLAGLSKIPSPQPPRAWFVSLEGKPAAEIRYSVSEQQRRRRPIESRDTSLDSGVDMSEVNQSSSGRKAVTLERKATFVKSKDTTKP